jgi:hypothetical protein
MQHRDSNALDVQRSMVDAICSIGHGLHHLVTVAQSEESFGLRHSYARRMRDTMENH